MEVMTAVNTRRSGSLPGYVIFDWSWIEDDEEKSALSFFAMVSFFSTSVDDLEVDGPTEDSILVILPVNIEV